MLFHIVYTHYKIIGNSFEKYFILKGLSIIKVILKQLQSQAIYVSAVVKPLGVVVNKVM